MNYKEEELRRRVISFIPCVGDIEDELEDFFYSKYTILLLKGDGVIGFTEHEEFFAIEFVYIDKFLSNAKLVYNTAKQLGKIKPVLYTGVKNHYQNNSTALGDGVFKINIGD